MNRNPDGDLGAGEAKFGSAHDPGLVQAERVTIVLGQVSVGAGCSLPPGH